jgi:starch synthase
MKVCLFSWEFPPNVYGGAGVHVTQLSRALADRVDLEVRTVAVGPSPKPAAVPVRRYPAALPEGAGTEALSGVAKALGVLTFNLRMVADPLSADIVHTHTWYTNLAGALAKKTYGCKLVATVHSLEPLRPWKREQLGSGYELSSWMERDGLESCDAVVAVSEGMKKDIRSTYDIPASRITVIHNGVDPQVFRKRDGSAVLRKFGLRKPFVLFVGRLVRQKGVFDLLQAMRHVPKGTTLALATGAPDTPEIVAELKAAVKGRPAIVWIPEMLGPEDLVGLYSEADVFVCPSIYEPFGIINLEAMGCETPVVATRVGGITEVVADGKTGLLVEPSEPRALGEAMTALLEDPERRRRMGAAGRARVLREFTWDHIADRLVTLYRSLV